MCDKAQQINFYKKHNEVNKNYKNSYCYKLVHNDICLKRARVSIYVNKLITRALFKFDSRNKLYCYKNSYTL